MSENRKTLTRRSSKQGRSSQQTEGGGMQAMIDYEQNQLRMKAEDREDIIRSMMEEGQITEEEAQVRFTRMQMHEKAQKDEEGGEAIKGIVAAGAGFQTTDQILDELLDNRSKFLLVRCLKDATGWSKLERKITLERGRRSSPKFKHPCPWLLRLVRFQGFELFLGLLMLFNAVTIGVAASNVDKVEWVQMCEQVFTTCFVLEVLLRAAVDGWTWFFTLVNAADTALIIFTGVVPVWILEPMGIDSGTEVRVIQVFRVLRLVRLVRMVRTVKQFRTLWKLLQGMLDSGRILMWMFLILAGVLYILAIFSVYWIGRAPALKENAMAQEHFGDVPKAMFTLFQTATLDSWTFIVRPLAEEAPNAAVAIQGIFLVCILLTTIVLLNLVTAIIVQTAFLRAEQDEELRVKELQEAAEEQIAELRDIFLEIDEDESGYLSRAEYDQAMKYNRRVQDKFMLLGIEEDEREEIWELLDDGNGDIAVDRFANLLLSLQGGAKAKAGFTIVKSVSAINKQYDVILSKLTSQQALVEQTMRECNVAHRQLGGALEEMLQFIVYAGACVPGKPAPTPKAALIECRELLERKVHKMTDEDFRRTSVTSPH